MSDQNKSIHEFDFELICEYYSRFARQVPGSQEVTKKALGFVDNLNENSRIADIGCGTGGQTIVLGQNAPGIITGLDLFPRFIDIFNQNAKTLNMHDRLKGIVGSMEHMPFQDEELDLIWSEGAIYNIGFERGLHEWQRYLKKGGYIAVSEASWFTLKRPTEINDFWLDAYPEIDNISIKITQMEKAGYVPVASFILPEHCWTDHFYAMQEPVMEGFLQEKLGNKFAEEFIENQRHEMKLYYKYKEYYGYVFYVGRKR